MVGESCALAKMNIPSLTEDADVPTRSSAKSSGGGRPRGKAPRGKRWSAELGQWEEDPEAASSASRLKTKRERSAFIGVVPTCKFSKVRGADQWTMRIKVKEGGVGGKEVSRTAGPFSTEEEAARAYDAVAGSLGRPVNFPAPGTGQARASKAQASSYRGVCWHKPTKHWTAFVSVHGRNFCLGYFKDEVSAARKFDEAAGPLGRALNFPDSAAALQAALPNAAPPPNPAVSMVSPALPAGDGTHDAGAITAEAPAAEAASSSSSLSSSSSSASAAATAAAGARAAVARALPQHRRARSRGRAGQAV